MKSEIRQIPLSAIEANDGQLSGVPRNPRRFAPDKMRLLRKSIKEDPEMLDFRPLVVFPHAGKYVVICGNMRLAALRELGYMQAPCAVLPSDTSTAKLRAYLIKDNASFGEWDAELLGAEWDAPLQDWGVDMPAFNEARADDDTPDTMQKEKRAGWHKAKTATDALCDMKPTTALHIHGGFATVTMYRRTNEGFPLDVIKGDETNVGIIGNQAATVLRQFLCLQSPADWCIVTTPKRRHKTHNFAALIAANIARRLGVTYVDDAIEARTRQRVNATFNLVAALPQKNVILFDDIVTTFSTITASRAVLTGKNVFCLVAINNNR